MQEAQVAQRDRQLDAQEFHSTVESMREQMHTMRQEMSDREAAHSRQVTAADSTERATHPSVR